MVLMVLDEELEVLMQDAEFKNRSFIDLVSIRIELGKIARQLGVEKFEEKFGREMDVAQAKCNGAYMDKPIMRAHIQMCYAIEKMHLYLQMLTLNDAKTKETPQ